MSGGGFRASAIPSNVRKTIQDIKEITGNHSDDEIYAMLKECSMDPNETAQKLLLQDTFHEVKRRRDRKKESQNSRDNVDMRWRSGPPGRSGRGGRGNYTSGYAAQDAGVGRNTSAAKENGINQTSDRTGLISLPPVAQDANSEDVGSSVTVMANGPVGVVSGAAKNVRNVDVLSRSGTKQPDMYSHSQRQLHIGASKRSNMASSERDAHGESVAPLTLSGVCTSASDPVLVPSDSRVPAAVSAIKREIGSHYFPVEPNPSMSADHKSNASKMVSKSQGVGKNQGAEFFQSHGSSSSSRPSSNYGTRSQQAMGSQKVGPNKEWKPKPINTNAVQGPKTSAAANSSNFSDEVSALTQPGKNIADSEDATKKLWKELENLQVRDAQHVIIPNHIHVPEAVRSGLSFGSFDSAFVITPSRSSEPENQTNSNSVSETHPETEAIVEEHTTSQNASAPAEEADYVDNSQSPQHVPDNLSSGEVSVPSSAVPDSSDSKKETASGPQHPGVNVSSSYNFALMPPILGNPLGPVEASETQARDVSRVPSFVVQPPVDPSNFYAQFYRSGQDTDGRISPFPAPGVAAKYCGNVTVLSSQTSQSPSEGGNSVMLSTTAQTPLAAQAAGVMPSSVAVTQQPMALFRQPPGIHIPHYPPNYVPYGHYFSPFYVPPPAMHQFLGNNAFPQQAQTGGVYPGPAAAAAATAVKFPISQYKPGSSPGNSAHMGVGGSYGPYGASPAGYNIGAATTAGNSTANEELAASQFKESNAYITGQQSEGSAVWIHASGREISSLPANFYNLPHQGQHVTFAPTQAGQGTFAGMYHPTQTVTAATVHPLLQQSQAIPGAVDMVGATASVYQQPQHPQLNWPNNY